MSASPDPRPAFAIDRILCSGHGICAQLLPEEIRLDEWGYPILTGADDVSPTRDQPERVAAAVRLCPARALRSQPG